MKPQGTEMAGWPVTDTHDAVRIQTFRWVGTPEPGEDEEPKPGERLGVREAEADTFVVLAVEESRDGERWSPMHAGRELRPETLAAVAIHEPEETRALEALARLGFLPFEAPREEASEAERPAR